MKLDIKKIENIEWKMDKKVEEDNITIYCIGAKNGKRYKIGRTKRNVEERLNELREVNPRYELIESYKCKHINGEKIIHKYLSENNIRRIREFFYYDDMEELKQILKELIETLNKRIQIGYYLKK